MRLPLGFGTISFSNGAEWLRSLVAAFVSGGASAFTSGLVVASSDPDHFALGMPNSYALMWKVFLVAGTGSAMAFLRSSPLPELKTVTTVVQTTQKQPESIVQTTVKEVHQEPIVPVEPKP
jgi:hypothetical protein